MLAFFLLTFGSSMAGKKEPSRELRNFLALSVYEEGLFDVASVDVGFDISGGDAPAVTRETIFRLSSDAAAAPGDFRWSNCSWWCCCFVLDFPLSSFRLGVTTIGLEVITETRFFDDVVEDDDDAGGGSLRRSTEVMMLSGGRRRWCGCGRCCCCCCCCWEG